ncbi:hypothetical protein M407DRAFT_157807 [Tulasnella calospora MUT 4182]|uniref:Uncharacterized protein n=1 Tax=Tulasnella calospora MUT 4182 TaxID=1051891 RepID=A0A0C3Q5U9_9AGAM|nr:hypothetical protein M407DRAFT_157807 [Tulasnella calospora MUT 4182]
MLKHVSSSWGRGAEYGVFAFGCGGLNCPIRLRTTICQPPGLANKTARGASLGCSVLKGSRMFDCMGTIASYRSCIGRMYRGQTDRILWKADA